MTQPIRTALSITQDALSVALSAVVDVFGGVPAVYWRQTPPGVAAALLSGALDGCIVCQSQDGGGRSDLFIGGAGWSGLITLRCIASTPSAARTLLASVPEPLLLVASGYAIRADWERPLDLPDAAGLSTAAGIYRIHISHA